MQKTTIKAIIDGDVNDLKYEWLINGDQWLMEFKKIKGVQEWWILNNALDPWLLFRNHWDFKEVNVDMMIKSAMDIVFFQEWMRAYGHEMGKNIKNPLIKTNKLDWLVWLEQFYWTKNWIWNDDVWIEVGDKNTQEVQQWIIKNKLKHDFCWCNVKTKIEMEDELNARKKALKDKIISFFNSKES